MEAFQSKPRGLKKSAKTCRAVEGKLFRGCTAAREKLLVTPAEGVFVVQEGVIRRCNLFLSEICGYRPEEVTETLFASFFDADTIPTVESAVQNAAAGEFPMVPGEARLVAKDGRRMKVRLTAQPCTYSGQPAIVFVLTEALGGCEQESARESMDQWFASEEEELPLSIAVDG